MGHTRQSKYDKLFSQLLTAKSQTLTIQVEPTLHFTKIKYAIRNGLTRRVLAYNTRMAAIAIDDVLAVRINELSDFKLRIALVTELSDEPESAFTIISDVSNPEPIL